MAVSYRGVDVSVVRSFLRGLREGTIYIAKVTKGGRGRRYSYLLPPVKLVEELGLGPGARLHVVIGEGYVDYIADEKGEYKLSLVRSNDARIRFPVDSVEGYVVVEPLPGRRGFRVYY